MSITETQSHAVLNTIGDKPDSNNHDVTTDINYTRIPDDGSLPTIDELHHKDPKFCDIRKTIIRDVRSADQSFDLDKNGFEYVRDTTPFIDFSNEEEVKKRHYPLIEQLIKDKTGAKKVKVFNHILRNAPVDPPNKRITDSYTSRDYKGPAQRPHVDNAPDYINALNRYVWLDEAESVLAGRHAVINVWRPLKTVK